ncbi:MAG: mannose-1-phosphate guanylyltransferase/mannose-6-phosphate isomerase [Bauldia sp.]|nr:mannose-1-phosphate guanylyltransferase/mannose-6-phosphate isomerase [Bauldia sp.]
MTEVVRPITPVILCGGAGTRLWPLSRETRPKPLLPLVGGTSTFAATLTRVADDRIFSAPLIVANRDQRHMLAAAMGEAGALGQLLLEPDARDTAAAIAAAVVFAAKRDPNALLLFLAADHHIDDTEGFRRTVAAAAGAAEAGRIVTFGVRPGHPATGYGYIARGAALPDADGVSEVAAFVEKPDAATAGRHVAAGYLWNSGNFLMTAQAGLAEFAAHAPDVLATATAAVEAAETGPDGATLLGKVFGSARRISFDHAVMEKTARAAVIDAAFDWSDLGTWDSVWAAVWKDAEGNAVQGDATLVAASGNFVSTDRPTIGLLGVDDLVVVASDDTVLVAPRSRSDEVKTLVSAIKAKPEAVIGDYARHYRPWGYYQSIDLGPAHQVKRLVVSPGQRLSLQKHRHRSEHWTVVEGAAEVTIDGRVIVLRPNESTYIPLGAVHRAANRGETTLTIIEVQCGDYLGEDDIIRFEDDYGRVSSDHVPPPRR